MSSADPDPHQRSGVSSTCTAIAFATRNPWLRSVGCHRQNPSILCQLQSPKVDKPPKDGIFVSVPLIAHSDRKVAEQQEGGAALRGRTS